MNIRSTDIVSDIDAPAELSANRQMRRIAIAGMTGTLIEFYDLQIYSTAAALIFAHLFFPELGRVAGTVAAFGTVGVAFVARPLGSVLFGHFGDRLGRKKTLVTSLTMMGLSTILVGLLPTGQIIGIWAPVLLVVLRFFQGIAAGGEFAGAALLISENAPPNRRGFWTAAVSTGGAMAVSSAALTFVITSLTMTDETFRAWGWRIPFLFSAVLLVIGLYIRLNMGETPVFAEEVRRKGTAAVPILEAVSKQWREIMLGCVVEVPAFTLLYLLMTYIVSYGSNELKLGYTEVLSVIVISGFVMAIGVITASSLSDRIGRRPVLIGSNLLAACWTPMLFPILEQGTLGGYAIAALGSILICGFIFGPAAAFMSELFQTRYRYTAVGLCYNAAGIVGGAVIPMVATPIVAAYGHLVFGCFLSFIALAGVGCCLALRETRYTSLGGS
jgi:MFS family permease